MNRIYSRKHPEKLLHIVRRKEEMIRQSSGREDLSPKDQFLQIASLKLPKNKTFQAHQHIWREGEPLIIPQESWIVISGCVQVLFYDVDGVFLDSHNLFSGDVSITFEGGHNYVIHAENTLIYEVKSARYYGQEKDKTFITTGI
jgi:hypothetical protein